MFFIWSLLLKTSQFFFKRTFILFNIFQTE
jgi:hypothetical protein